MSVPRPASRTARERAIRVAAGWGAPHSISTEDQIDDGELIATAAVRLAVKNDLILRALGNRQDYDDAALADSVRRELLALADEKEQNVDRVEGIRRSLRRRWRPTRLDHGYRRADLGLLGLRQKIDAGLAIRLRRLVEDDAYIAKVIATARDAALDEIARSVRDRFGSLHSMAMVDEAYEREREERIRGVLADLAALERAADEAAGAS